MTGKELLKKCVDKDRNAWDLFIRKYQGVVYRSVRYKLRRLNMRYPEREIRDIVQEVFLRLWEKERLAKVKTFDALEGWLAMVSINYTANYCRKRAFSGAENSLSLSGQIPGSFPGARLEDVISSGKLNTAKELESAEIKRALESEISKLEPRQRLVLKFNLYEGKKRREIADIMNIPLGTAAVLLKRARDRVRSGLERELELKKC